jgi:putative MATE family efflux protein
VTISKHEQSKTESMLVQGNLWQAIWVMSWPLLLTTISSSLIGLVDMHVAGMLGSGPQAAVGVSEQVLFIFMIFIMSVGVGTTAMVSRAAGAGDHAQVLRATSQSILLSVCLGLCLALGSSLGARFAVGLFSSSKEVVALSATYLGIYSVYLIPFSITAIVSAAFRAIGDAKTPLFIIAVLTAINITGDYATVLGNWPVPGLGVAGIAASAVVGSTVASILAIILLKRSTLGESLQHLWPPSSHELRRILNIGIPSAFQRMGWAMSVFILFFILARCEHPTEALAAWTVGMRVEGLVFMPLMALSLAVSSIVGQNLGAKQIDRAVRAGWHVTWIGVWMMLVLGGLMFIFAEPVAHIMCKDAATSTYTAWYLRINALGEPPLAVGMVLSGALQGAGDTRTPMWITVVTHWIARIPLAWFLSLKLGYGPTGVWIAMSSSVFFMAVLAAWRFKSQAWLKTQV